MQLHKISIFKRILCNCRKITGSVSALLRKMHTSGAECQIRENIGTILFTKSQKMQNNARK